MSFQKTWAASRETKAATGFRSRLEEGTAKHLRENNVDFLYEAVRIPYLTPSFYLPDFALPKQCIIIEDKGAFDSADRTKMVRIKAEHPDLDIRFLFSNPNQKITKGSKTTYGAWCHKHGFPFAKGPGIPADWLTHSPSRKQEEAFKRIFSNAT